MGDNIDFVCSYEHNYCQNCLLHSKSTERGGYGQKPGPGFIRNQEV